MTLRFLDDGLERDFSEDYFRKTLGHVRVTLLVGTFLYAIFGVLDLFVIPEARSAAWFIRYAVVGPFLVIVYLLSFYRHFKKLMQPLLVFMILVAGIGIIAMPLHADPPGSYLYYAGLILVTMFAYTSVKLRFLHATAVSWTIVAVYEAAAILIGHVPLSILLNNSFFLVAANLIGMFAGHQIEIFIRQDFLQRRLLGELEEKKHLMEKERILRDLHDGAGGMVTNIAMLAEMAQEETSLEEIKKALSGISELARAGLAEIRGFIQSLDVREMTWQNCVAELRYLGATMLEPHGIAFVVTASLEGERPQASSLLYLNLFKIFREAMTNVVKHSKATTVDVRLSVNREGIFLSIEDNGMGLANGAGCGRGLGNMRMRAEEIGGRMMITPGPGTRIDLEIPLPLKYPGQVMELPSLL